MLFARGHRSSLVQQANWRWQVLGTRLMEATLAEVEAVGNHYFGTPDDQTGLGLGSKVQRQR